MYSKLLIFLFLIASSLKAFALEKLVIETKKKSDDKFEERIIQFYKSNEKINIDYTSLIDNIIAHKKDYINLKILLKSTQDKYNIKKINGWINSDKVLFTEHDFFLKEDFSLFDGFIPEGKYKFKLNIILNSKVENKGNWVLENDLDIESSSEEKKYIYSINTDKYSNVPRLSVEEEVL